MGNINPTIIQLGEPEEVYEGAEGSSRLHIVGRLRVPAKGFHTIYGNEKGRQSTILASEQSLRENTASHFESLELKGLVFSFL